jgi:flagellar biosynthetic protein FlhB
LLGGWVFTSKPLIPDFGRLSPARGLGNIFSFNGVAELAKMLLEAGTVVAAVSLYVKLNYPSFAALSASAGGAGYAAMGRLVITAFMLIVLALAGSTAVDVVLTLWRYHRGLRMSVQEVKQESRESEGDPQMKARIRNQQRAIARRRMMQQVPRADVVVTNPTHYAVALKYEEGRNAAPVVLAMGMHAIAQRIREVAVDAGVPLVEAPPLARALYTHCDLGREIPQPLYTAVAQVLAFVFNLRRHDSRMSREPYELDNVDLPPLPPGLDPMEAAS